MKVENYKLKIVLLSTLYLLVATFLTGCATAPTVSHPRLKETVRIDGARYISAPILSEIYNLDYHFDYISKKITLSKSAKEAKMIVGSSVALLNDKVRIMEKEAKFYQGVPVIANSFARRTLAPFFKEEDIRRELIPTEVSGPIKKVIIDPGHGGRDPGAIGRGGLKEKDVTLDIARRLKRRLNTLGVNVILTRESDKYVTLTQRNHTANKNAGEGSFFISIHANASRSRWVSGIEVFYLSESIDDNLRAFQAAKNYNLNLKERCSGKDTPAILWDLIHTDDRKSSNYLAELVGRSLSRNLSQRNRGVKQRRFYVLKAHIPTILVEVGFISNAREEKKLRDSSYRDKIAKGIAEGISQYNRNFAQRRTARY